MAVMNVMEKINAELKNRGMTARALAELIEVKPDVIYRWRRGGEGQPSNEQIIKIANVLKMPESYFLNPNMEEPPKPAITDDEVSIIILYRALEISRDEAFRRLSTESKKSTIHQPIAEHRGDHGSPDELTAGSKGKHTSAR
jgi:transcriptional regulator with XRE-family HTH domain